MQLKNVKNTLIPNKTNELGHIRSFQKVNTNKTNCSNVLMSNSDCYRFFFICSGKFEWKVGKINYTLLPNDTLTVVPDKNISTQDGDIDNGVFYQFVVHINERPPKSFEESNNWTGISNIDFRAINNLLLSQQSLLIPKYKHGVEIFEKLSYELENIEIGYRSKVNALIDDMFISTARMSGLVLERSTDFKGLFVKLDNLLHEKLAHPWTVSEMANVVGYGVTSFTEKVKSHCGFSPMNYMINLRITEAIRLLKNTSLSITQIGLQTGFYSSQHFSTTFKKVSGYSPKEYRKKLNRA